MALHTPSSGTGIRPHVTHYGSTPIIGYRESTASTFEAGHLVQLDQDAATNTHRVESASSNSSAYLGVAADNASSQQDTLIPIYIADQNARFIGWSTETLLSSMVGKFRSFKRDTTLGIDHLDGIFSTARCQITAVGLDDIAGGPYAIGDTGGYVEFRFLSDHTVFGRTSTTAI